MDVVPSNKIPQNAEGIRRSISTLHITYPNPDIKIRASISFTDGANNFGKQQLDESNNVTGREENSKEGHVLFIWTKQLNSLEPFMVSAEMLTYQGRKYSETDIAKSWKKDCRMWLWKTKQRILSKKVNRKFNEILKDIKRVDVSLEDFDIMDLLTNLQNLRLK